MIFKLNYAQTGFFLYLIFSANICGGALFEAERGAGRPVLAADARSLALGEASVASLWGARAVYYNPANMGEAAGREVNLSAGLFNLNRHGREENYYSSMLVIPSPNFSFMTPLGAGFFAGMGKRAFSDLNYSYSRKKYLEGTADSLYLNQAGGIDKFTGALSYDIINNFSAGVGIDFLYGKIEGAYVKTDRIDLEEGERDIEEIKGGLSGISFKYGIALAFSGGRFRAGLSYVPPYEIKYEEKRVTAEEIEKQEWLRTCEKESSREVKMFMPSSAGGGFFYDFGGEEYSALAFELEKISWSGYNYKCGDEKNTGVSFRDVLRISVGTEHELQEDVFIRCGFVFHPSYADSAVDLSMFTAGAGFSLSSNTNIDLAAAVGRRSLRRIDYFSSTPDSVDEYILKIMAGIDWSF